jgi:long-chain acyl-CoA synthetase
MKLHALVASHARRVPERLAVVSGSTRRTYAELGALTRHLARGLRAGGLGPGDRVVLYLGNGVPLVELLLAVLDAGGIAVPVTTWLVAPELRHVIADTAPHAIAYGDEHRAVVDAALEGQPAVRRLVVGPSSPGEQSLEDLARAGAGLSEDGARAPGSDDAIIAYTSGTTGFPKGAIVTHANLVAQSYVTSVAWGLTESDRFLATTPIAHRTGLARVANALVLGATVVVMPRFDAAGTVRLIEDEGITVMGMVPTIGRMLLERLPSGRSGGESLRVVLVTGEAFPLEVKRGLAERWPAVRLYSFFAMTEAGIVTMLGPDEQFTHPASVGRPLPGVEVRVVDDRDHDVAPGEIGEVLVRCGEPGRWLVTRGYWNRPDADREAFLDGFLRTGDLGRLDGDGHLYIVDRRKDMILSGGLNIYSKEVERALEAYPCVAEAAVVGAPDPLYGEAVVAYVVPRPGAVVEPAALIEHCRAIIAGYKKPRHVRIVDALPRNSLAKVLKEELRRRERGCSARSPGGASPPDVTAPQA